MHALPQAAAPFLHLDSDLVEQGASHGRALLALCCFSLLLSCCVRHSLPFLQPGSSKGDGGPMEAQACTACTACTARSTEPAALKSAASRAQISRLPVHQCNAVLEAEA
jgi:hypothetical protein